jgi:uncharacterized protein YegP (UPF0339 family)
MFHFEIFKDASSQYRWRFRSSNGQIIAVSGEGYIRRGDCEHAINLVKQRAASAPVQALAY